MNLMDERSLLIGCHMCKECFSDGVKVALKVTRLFYMMLLSILLSVKLAYVLPVSH